MPKHHMVADGDTGADHPKRIVGDRAVLANVNFVELVASKFCAPPNARFLAKLNLAKVPIKGFSHVPKRGVGNDGVQEPTA